MIFLPDERNIKKKWYQNEVEELREYALQKGLTQEQTLVFVRNSILNLIKSEYYGVVDDAELVRIAESELADLDLKYDG